MNQLDLIKDLLGKATKRFTQRQLASNLGVNVRTVRRWFNQEYLPSNYIVPALNNLLSETAIKSEMHSAFTFIDLFAGIGGFRLAFEEFGGRCVYTSEWNEFSAKTYFANFRVEHPFDGDITKVPANRIPSHDVLLAGFPCQPFSIAGISKKKSLGMEHGFKDKAQGTLFFDIARIIEEKKPAAFLLENVKNLLNHDKGNTFRIIMDTLEKELGYYCYYRIIDAQIFVPQHRERIYIVGFRKNVPFDWNEFACFYSETDKPVLGDILHPEDGSEPPESDYTSGEKAIINEKYTLSDKLWNYLRKYAEKHRMKGNGFGYGLFGPQDVVRTLSARYYKDGSEILIKNGQRSNPRRLTPRECSRLMGFDTDQRKFVIPVSDTQAYKQFGNAVVVPVIREIARIMTPRITAIKTTRKRKMEDSQLQLAI